jgi:UDP-MurNAc hydroxylase
MAVTVRYIYSACAMFSTPDARVLCDPWITPGIHDGSWFQFPYFDDLYERLGTTDFIYVSHIHQDHYDLKFLRRYLREFPDTRVIIADFDDNFLARKMKIDRIPHEIVRVLTVGDTEIALFPNHQHAQDIDSAIAVRHGGHSVVNMNDNVYHQDLVDRVLAFAPEPTIALLPYTGAGSYPHTFYEVGDKLVERAAWKKQVGFTRFGEYCEAMKPKAIIPFAGKYVLGGRLHYLNAYRGNPDPIEALTLDPRVVIPVDGGVGTIDTDSLQASEERTEPYDARKMDRYLMSIANRPMDYELTFGHLEVSNVPFPRLLAKAYQTALARGEAGFDYWYCIWLGDKWFAMNANINSPECGVRADVSGLEHRSEIFIDLRYLYGLLTLTYHWNNAEGGSQYFTRRNVDEFHREVNDFLNFLHV